MLVPFFRSSFGEASKSLPKSAEIFSPWRGREAEKVKGAQEKARFPRLPRWCLRSCQASPAQRQCRVARVAETAESCCAKSAAPACHSFKLCESCWSARRPFCCRTCSSFTRKRDAFIQSPFPRQITANHDRSKSKGRGMFTPRGPTSPSVLANTLFAPPRLLRKKLPAVILRSPNDQLPWDLANRLFFPSVFQP